VIPVLEKSFPSRELCGRTPPCGGLERSSRRQANRGFHGNETLLRKARTGRQIGSEASKAAGRHTCLILPGKSILGAFKGLRRLYSKSPGFISPSASAGALVVVSWWLRCSCRRAERSIGSSGARGVTGGGGSARRCVRIGKACQSIRVSQMGLRLENRAITFLGSSSLISRGVKT
jgi:hypothetical protein